MPLGQGQVQNMKTRKYKITAKILMVLMVPDPLLTLSDLSILMVPDPLLTLSDLSIMVLYII